MTSLESVADGEYTAVVDSIEDRLVTVFIEHESEEVGNTVIAAERLPSEGQHADAVFTVAVSDGEIDTMAYLPDETKSRAADAQRRFDRLSERPSSDRRETE